MKHPSPLVLLHGALNDASVWAPVLPLLASGRSVLALDLPGHGLNKAQAPVASIEALADWVWEELDRRGIAEAALAGHSMGSLIALEAASRRPERAIALVMVGTAFPMRVNEVLLSSARDTPDAAITLIDSYSRSQPDEPGRLLALMRRVLAEHPALNLLEHDLRLCDSYTHGLDAAAKVRCPALLILGSLDKMTPAKRAQALAEALRATVCSLAAGHALMAEAPGALSNAVKELLETSP